MLHPILLHNRIRQRLLADRITFVTQILINTKRLNLERLHDMAQSQLALWVMLVYRHEVGYLAVI